MALRRPRRRSETVAFQYSIGDAKHRAPEYVLREEDAFNTPLEMRVSELKLATVQVLLTFNTPLEMLPTTRRLRTSARRCLSILHWRCAGLITLQDLPPLAVSFNTPLEMQRRVERRNRRPPRGFFQYSIGDALGV